MKERELSVNSVTLDDWIPIEKRISKDRQCVICKSNKTGIQFHKKTKRYQYQWFRDMNNPKQYVCKKCHNIQDRDGNNRRTLKQYHEIRQFIVKTLGSKCVKCGFSDIHILQVDHIMGGGGEQIKKLGWSNWHVYRFYRAHQDLITQELQLLCPNCNALKRIDNDEMPYRKHRKLQVHRKDFEGYFKDYISKRDNMKLEEIMIQWN